MAYFVPENLKSNSTLVLPLRAIAKIIESLLLRDPHQNFSEIDPQSPGILPKPEVMNALQAWTMEKDPESFG